ncbi:MAG: RNA-binding S4 domain-containing protein [Gammaproteobacteria bacterium]|nr:RNA-binding S4 domain-containing protein [Gammaproteobacteria bacterium]
MDDKVRLDKWLWAARFFKTRALASEAVTAGHVEVGGARAKPARPVKVGDELTIRKGVQVFVVHVREVSERRGSATVAQQLYEETADSRYKREAAAEQHRLAALLAPAPQRRPDKRDRRRIMRFNRAGD